VHKLAGVYASVNTRKSEKQWMRVQMNSTGCCGDQNVPF